MTSTIMSDPALQARFLKAYAETRIVDVAARRIGVSEGTIATARRRDPSFGAAVKAAMAVPLEQKRKLRPLLPADRQRFLAALGLTGCASDAALKSGVNEATVYTLKRRDAGFAAAWASARDDARDRAYGRMLKAAIEGFVRTETVDGVEKRIVSHEPRSVLALLDLHRDRAEAGRGRMIELTPELARRARASLVRKLTSGGGLTTMAEAIEHAATQPVTASAA